jgi:hypothetical protein
VAECDVAFHCFQNFSIYNLVIPLKRGISLQLGTSGYNIRFKNGAFKTLQHHFSTSSNGDSPFQGNDNFYILIFKMGGLKLAFQPFLKT